MSFDFELPHGWRWETIETLKASGRSIVSGPFGSNIGKRFFVDNGVPVVRGNNLSLGMERFNDDGFVFLTEEKAAEFKSCEAHPNDLLFTAAGTIGQVGIVPPRPRYPKYIISNKQLRARLDPEQIQPLFAYYWLASPPMVEMIQSRNTGSTIPLINLSVLKSLPVPVPPIEVQKAIVDILSVLDDRITLLRETNATLEAIAQALFKSWFVDFDPVRAKQEGRAPDGMDEATAALFPDSFEESELGLVPIGWQLSSLHQLCNISSGKRPNDRSDVQTSIDSIPLFGGAGIMGFTKDALFDTPKILTGRVGTLGKIHIAYPPFWASDNVLVLSPIESRSFYFCFHWINSIDVHSLNRGSTQPLLTQRDLGNQGHVIPPVKLLEAFAEIAQPLYEKSRANAQQAQTLATLRDTLLPRLISGQLRLPDAEAVLAGI